MVAESFTEQWGINRKSGVLYALPNSAVPGKLKGASEMMVITSGPTQADMPLGWIYHLDGIDEVLKNVCQ